MHPIIPTQPLPLRLKYLKIFSFFLLCYALIIFALAGSHSNIHKDLHLMLDVSNGILSLMLALFLLAEQNNIEPNVRKYLVIGFGFAAATELLHAFAGIAWAGWFALMGSYANIIWPATWPPSTYVLPIALLWALWLMRHQSVLQPIIYAAGMVLISVTLFILAFYLPQYVDTGLLGIQRPTQIPVLVILLLLIHVCWRERARSPLFEGLAWMSALLFLSDLFMLYSTSTLGDVALMAHAGKFMAYSFFHLIQMRVAAEDTRARKVAEAALIQEETNLLQAMDDLVFQQYALDQHSIVGITDVQGKITYANESFCAISGYTREELIGNNHRLINSGVHPTDFFRDMYRTISAGNVWKGEICNRSKDGSLFWLMTTIVPVLDGSGQPRQYVSMRTDITERKLAEQDLLRYQNNLEALVAEQTLDLKHAKEVAEAASRAKSEFLANMSHEIRTPMNGVVGIVDILQETPLSQAQQRLVDTIRASSLALLGILGDILDISKIEAGKLEVEFIPVNLRELVEEVVQVLAPNVADKDMDLIVFLPPEIPAWISTDPGRLRQILFNLLSNAVKFTHSDRAKRGQVMLRIELESVQDGQRFLKFRIIDNGIGMTPETVSQLFTAFVQADATTTRRFGGTGLGLSISKHLAGLLHGQIHVSSKLERGTEFCLYLPLNIALPNHAPAISSELSGMKVLIVTEHAVYEELLPAYLQLAGAEIKVVASHQAALNELRQSGESDWVVLLDMTHASEIDPGIGESIRNEFSPVPVVLLVSRRISTSLGKEKLVLANPLLFDELVHTLAAASRSDCLAKAIQKPERRRQPHKVAPTVKEAMATGQLILVAEDNEISREVIQEQLQILGYASEAAEDGQVALEMWRSGRYSLLFTDCHMPNIDGFSLAAAIRMEEPEGSRLPIIAVTGNAMQGEAQRCIASGMDDYLPKPLRLSDLGGKLAKWLSQKQSVVVKEPAPELSVAESTLSVEIKQSAAAAENIAVDVVWDDTTLKRMVGDKPAMHRRLLDKFLLGAEEQVAAIINAVAAGDLVTAAAVAHKLKSAARTVGALRLGQLCQALETSGLAGDTGAVHIHVAGLAACFIDVSEKIKSSH